MSSVLPLAEILSAANSNVGTEFTPVLVDAIQKLSAHPEGGKLRIELAGNLPLIKSPTGAGLLAVWYGAGVEHGAKPSDSYAAVLQTFLRWSRTIKSDDAQPPSDATIAGLQLIGQSLVAHLRHDANLVKELANQPATISELERVEGDSVGAAWVMQLVRIRSGNLVVLHPQAGTGLIATYENISNNFHLFTLLQGAIATQMPGGRVPDERVLKVARGDLYEDMNDAAWWHYNQPISRQPDIAQSIWGEGSPDEIGTINGTQVMLLHPPIMQSRSWDAGFTQPIILSCPPRVRIDRWLSADECAHWLNQIPQ